MAASNKSQHGKEMNKEKAAKQGISHSDYASQVVALSNIYSATPWKGVRKTYYKGTPDRIFRQMKTIFGNCENCMQICTLMFNKHGSSTKA